MTTATAQSNLRQETLPVFVQAIMHYFDHITGVPAETETPYIQEGASDVSDVTAIIGVSGELQGCVYYTASSHMLDQLLSFVAEHEPTDELRCDMAGEVANTLSGNARKQLGSGFMISTPVVVQGKTERIFHYKGSACFVIPILWKNQRSLLKICLMDTPASFDLN